MATEAGASSSRSPPATFQILPMLGVSFFTITIGKSNVGAPFQLTIPENFRQYFPADRQEVVLLCTNSGRPGRDQLLQMNWEVQWGLEVLRGGPQPQAGRQLDL